MTEPELMPILQRLRNYRCSVHAENTEWVAKLIDDAIEEIEKAAVRIGEQNEQSYQNKK